MTNHFPCADAAPEMRANVLFKSQETDCYRGEGRDLSLQSSQPQVDANPASDHLPPSPPRYFPAAHSISRGEAPVIGVDRWRQLPQGTRTPRGIEWQEILPIWYHCSRPVSLITKSYSANFRWDPDPPSCQGNLYTLNYHGCVWYNTIE